MTRTLRAALFALPLLWLPLAACQQNTIPTPTRVLDLPSDMDLFCVDVDFVETSDGSGVCLPLGTPPRDDDPDDVQQAFLDKYCNYAPPALTQVQTQDQVKKVTVLERDQCSDINRQRHRQATLGPLLKIARRLGRSEQFPCCDAGSTTCALSLSTCKRRKLFSLVTNSARGEVAVIDTDAVTPGLNTVGQIENLSSGRPGFGFLPAGVLPDHVRTAAPSEGDQGTREAPRAYGVVTNLGSCDLSVIGLKRVADRLANLAVPTPTAVDSPATCGAFPDLAQVDSCRVGPYTVDPKKELGASPAFVEVAPWDGPQKDPQGNVVGFTRRALVAFPRCGLVADIDLATGQIKEGVSLRDAAPRVLRGADLASFTCPAECGGNKGVLAGMDANQAGGAPAGLALDRDGRRLLIADALGSALLIMDYDDSAMADGKRLSNPRLLPLDFAATVTAGQRGLDGVRVSRRGAAGLFAYARARDATVRVIDLDREKECETNPDPRALQARFARGDLSVWPDDLIERSLRSLGCFPVGTIARNPTALSPGIGLAGGSMPTDVAFAQLGVPCDPSDPDCAFNKDLIRDNWISPIPQLFVGDYAWILGTNGRAVAVQQADRCPLPSYRACDADQAAWRRVVMLNGLSPYAAISVDGNDPASYALPTAVSVSVHDRLGNVPRTYASRFSEATLGPRVQLDASGVPRADARVNVTTVNYANDVANQGTRLVLPAPAVYPQLPVDPICDVTPVDAARRQEGGVPTSRPQRLASFPDPTTVSSEVWTLSWEGVLDGLSRSTGRLRGGELSDLTGLYCSRGAERGDKLGMRGCTSDADCAFGSTCYLSTTRPTLPGLCFKTLADRDKCRSLSAQFTTDPLLPGQDPAFWAAAWTPRYRILSASEDSAAGSMAALQEIAAPEFSVQQTSCQKADLGKECPGAGVHLPDENGGLLARQTTCRIDHDLDNKPIYRCTVECDATVAVPAQGASPARLGCGTGYVCARSPYEEEETAADLKGAKRGRCVRAPLLTENSLVVKERDAQGAPKTVEKAQAAGLKEILDACYPEFQRYEIRAGDAFLVGGSSSGAATFARAQAPGGLCKRPGPGDANYERSRLQQGRLPLGPRVMPSAAEDQANEAQGAALWCPKRPAQLVGRGQDQSDWINHRAAPPPAEALAAGTSCGRLFNNGLSGDLNFCVADGRPAQSVCLPTQTNVFLPFERASDFLRSRQADVAADPWLHHEYELYSSLGVSASRRLRWGNSCVLFGTADKPGETCLPGEPAPCSRRIHYENTAMNLVLRVPRLTETQNNVRQWISDEWAVPDDGYSVSFSVVGGLVTYALPVGTNSGQLAQGLRSATESPDGAIYVVDQGRTGTATGLRGQLMRILRGIVDGTFLIR